LSQTIEATPYDRSYLKPTMVVFDTVYNPQYTQLLRDAQAVGCRIVTGVEMFVRQGARQFELFTGQTMTTNVAAAPVN
jgi:3-dehydroquinate dehydratase/shikimate dehydrogenase